MEITESTTVCETGIDLYNNASFSVHNNAQVNYVRGQLWSPQVGKLTVEPGAFQQCYTRRTAYTTAERVKEL